MVRAFICYGRQDAQAVGRLATDIDELGHDAWFDQELSGGQAWWDQILQRVRTVDVVVLALSPHSLASDTCKRELGYAADVGRPILPVLVSEGVDVDLLPPALSTVQYVDYREGDRKALASLSRAFGSLPEPGPLPDPLPPAPALPISKLGQIRERLEAAAALSEADQSTLLVEIRQVLRNEKTRTDGLILLRSFRKRRDLLATIAWEIDASLERFDHDGPQASSPGRGSEPTPRAAQAAAPGEKRISAGAAARAAELGQALRRWASSNLLALRVGGALAVVLSIVVVWQLWSVATREAPTVGTFAASAGQDGVALSWETSGARRVAILPEVGEVERSGSLTAPPGAPEFMLLAYGRGGVTRRVIPSGVARPAIIEFSVADESITRGDDVTLTWSTTDAETVELDPGGPVRPNDQLTVAPTSTTEYELIARGLGGVARQSVLVTVRNPPAPPPLPSEDTVQLPTPEPGGSGTVTGRVTDAGTGAPISAVQVFIETSSIGALSQQNGYYLLVNVPSGIHPLTVARIGYRQQTRQISVSNGATVVADFQMVEEALQLEEVVVSGRLGSSPSSPPAPPEAEDGLNAAVWLPGGAFQMGSSATPEEGPIRTVTVAGFWMQEHEVTHAEYARFRPEHRYPADEARHPVTGVSWEDAMEYALSRGGSLPTEAEWEFASRGQAGRTFPWGGQAPDCSRANYAGCRSAPAEVMSLPEGATPGQGRVYDLAGNVSEWVFDLFGPYDPASTSDPQGPESGPGFVSRGGSFATEVATLRGTHRQLRESEASGDPTVGFRLVWRP